jgi:hypothetical protein
LRRERSLCSMVDLPDLLVPAKLTENEPIHFLFYNNPLKKLRRDVDKKY